jgi:hypothetical protein
MQQQPSGMAEKRKAGSISRGGGDDDMFVDSPRKKLFSPVITNSPNTQRKMQAARERLAAAERQKQELKEKYEYALLVRKEKKEVLPPSNVSDLTNH